jgi:hypothetical protein
VLSLLGSQILSLGVFSRTFSYLSGFDRFDKRIEKFISGFQLEKGILYGGILFLAGTAIFISILARWIRLDFGELSEIRKALLATTLTVLGIQVVFSSFFISFLIQEKNAFQNKA